MSLFVLMGERNVINYIYNFPHSMILFVLLFIFIILLYLCFHILKKNGFRWNDNITINEFRINTYEGYSNFNDWMREESYLKTLEKDHKEVHFPYRYTQDEKGNILPLVMVTGFFRDDLERQRFDEYINNGVKVIGVTAYKTFPKPITDVTGDSDSSNDTFDYYNKIQNWLCCFDKPKNYGFTANHQLANISESDFYDAEQEARKNKKYDLIYICLDDTDIENCPMHGWNAINRNFKLALACFPILIHEMKLRVLVIGRQNCGLEKLYGDRITVMGFLPWDDFQEKLRESSILFVPNIYDASPRVIAEALTKGLPVLMNRSIVCGSKYVVPETGELFTDENDIRWSIQSLLTRLPTMDTIGWWKQHYSRKKSGEKLHKIIESWYPGFLPSTVREIYFRL